MGILSSRIENKFLDSCEKRLSQVDNSLTSLASSIDSVHGAIKLLLPQLQEIVPDILGEGSDESIMVNNNVLNLTRDLLSSVELTLYKDKITVLQEISDFIHLLKDKADNKNTLSKHMPTLFGLSIDKYISDFQKKNKLTYGIKTRQTSSASIGPTGSSVDPEKTVEGLEQKLKQIEKDKEKLKLTNVMLKTENDEKGFEIKKLKEEIEKSQLEIDKRTAEMSVLVEEKSNLQNDLDKALRRVENIPIQVYYQRRGEMIGLIEEELLTKLNEHLSDDNKELEVIKCETSAHIQPDKPLLVLCISTSRLGTDAKTAIQGVLNIEHSALLIFHHKDEHALPSQSSERVLAGPEFKALGGIFDLAFLTGKGVYACEMNSRAIQGVVKFMCNVSEEICPAQRKTNDVGH